MVLSDRAIALTRRPVKDKGALMQTLHLRFRALRAISLRQSLSRWPTPSDATRAGMKGPPGLSNSPGPTSAVGSRPANSHQRIDRCPTVGAGLSLVSRFREPSFCGAGAPDRRQGCRALPERQAATAQQTASVGAVAADLRGLLPTGSVERPNRCRAPVLDPTALCTHAPSIAKTQTPPSRSQPPRWRETADAVGRGAVSRSRSLRLCLCRRWR